MLTIFTLSTLHRPAYLEYLSIVGKLFHWLYFGMDLLIDSESLMVVLLFVPMYIGIRNFSTRDALWLGCKLLWGLHQIYYSICTLYSSWWWRPLIAMPLRVDVSWIVAKDKAILLKNPNLDHQGVAGQA